MISACNRFGIVLTILVYFLSGLTPINAADTPNLVQYTGLLTDSSGNPLPDGSYKAVFNLYIEPTGGTSIWTENWDFSDAAHPKIATQNGRFTVLLGNNTDGGIPESLFQDNQSVFLGISVEDDPEMLPRQRITSVPFALVAGDGVPRGGIIMWSGALGAIPVGWALCDGDNNTPDLRNRFIVGSGDAYDVDDAGGNAIVSIPSHTHTTGNKSLSANSAGNHAHPFSGTTSEGNKDEDDIENGNDEDASNDDHTHTFSGNTHTRGAHNHSINAHNHSVTSAGGTSISTIPPYYALAYIMKL